jgi:hypothetical protein
MLNFGIGSGSVSGERIVRAVLRLMIFLGLGVALSGCAAVSVVDMAASVTGTVISATASVAGSVVSGAASTISGSDEDKDKSGNKDKDKSDGNKSE